MLIFDQLYKTDSFAMKAIICASLAFFLSPRKKIVTTQTGKIKQITWLFFKKPVILK